MRRVSRTIAQLHQYALLWIGGSILHTFAKSCSRMSCCQAARRTTFLQGIGEHMNGPTILASSTMRPKWFSRGRICHSLRLSFCFSPSTQGQLPASCQILFVSPARLCFILRILTSHALTVVLLHTCTKKIGTSGMVDTGVTPSDHTRIGGRADRLLLWAAVSAVCSISFG